MSKHVSRRSVIGGLVGGAIGATGALGATAGAAHADEPPPAYDSTLGNFVLGTSPTSFPDLFPATGA